MVLDFFKPTPIQRQHFKEEWARNGPLFAQRSQIPQITRRSNNHRNALPAGTVMCKEPVRSLYNPPKTYNAYGSHVRFNSCIYANKNYAGYDECADEYYEYDDYEDFLAPLSTNSLKIWTDGSFHPRKRFTAGLGVFINPELSYCRQVRITRSRSGSLEAEALAVLFALEIAEGLGQRNVEILCDNQTVLKAMNCFKIPRVPFIDVFKMIRNLAARSFDSVQYRWVKAHEDPGNIEADQLAWEAATS